MTINKYTGKTEEEAMSKVRKELGNAAVIMNVKVIKPKGLGGLFKSNTYEVTAAVEDDDVRNNPFVPEEVASAISNSQEKASGENESSGFDAVADDAIMLKNAFSAVNEVLEKQEDKSMPKQEFEPLSDSAPRTRLIEPTYSKPVGMRPVVAPIEEPRVKVTQAVETPASRANIQPESVSAQTSQPSIDNEDRKSVV